ncbi:MAG: hypothetical protein FWE06_07295 [Oscillospiraceae bacterium]|nr:hypothetical protein [Oscillospiraceae bacterium]
MKKLCLLLLAMVLLLTACNGASDNLFYNYNNGEYETSYEPPTNGFGEKLEFPDDGLTIMLPDTWQGESDRYRNLEVEPQPGRIDFVFTPDAALALLARLDDEYDMTDDERMMLWSDFEAMRIHIATVLVIGVELADAGIHVLEARELFYHEVVIGDQGDYRYLFFYDNSDDYDREHLSAEERERFNGLIDTLEQLQSGIAMTERTIPGDATNFSALTLDGEGIDSHFIQQYRMTVVLLWATWNEESLDILPNMAQLQPQLPDDVGLLAIVTDIFKDVEQNGSQGDEFAAVAANVVAAAGIEFPVLAGNASLFSIMELGRAFPTLLFYNRDGQLLGPAIVPPDTSVAALLGLVDDRLVMLGAVG